VWRIAGRAGGSDLRFTIHDSRFTVFIKHLPRIEYAVGVEGALDAAHGVDGRGVERQVEVRGLDVADAVLAADGAA
jgi:hypothetical protein